MRDLKKIENPKFYVDRAIKLMGESANKTRDEISKKYSKSTRFSLQEKDTQNLNKRKDLELSKIKFLEIHLSKVLSKMILDFKPFRNLGKIYIDLLDASNLKYDNLLKSLEKLNWIKLQIEKLVYTFERKIKISKSDKTVGFVLKKFLGRLNSYFTKEKTHFLNLEKARMFLKTLPNFEKQPLCIICGFPNVGKSTLMREITGAKVEINNYPFTTKKLLTGFLQDDLTKKVMLVDTPGLLNRSSENEIEKKASIVIHKYSSFIVYVFDITEICGYSIKSQLKLLKSIEDLNKDKPILIYFSKTDLYDEELEETHNEFVNKHLKKKNKTNKKEEVKKQILENF